MNKIHVRRAIRVALLLILFCLILALPWILILALVQESEFSLEATKLTKITMTNCELFFVTDDSLPITQPTIFVKTARDIFEDVIQLTQTTESKLELTITNNYQYSSGCSATIKHHSSTKWNDLVIHCADGACAIVEKSPGTTLHFNNFNVTGSEVNLNLLDVTAQSIMMNVDRGTLTLNHATIQGQSTISTQDGDVIFQSSNDYLAHWQSQNSYFCMGVPSGASILPVQSPSGCWLNPEDHATGKKIGGQTSTNCSASYSLCSSGTCSNTPNITLSAGKGSIYSNLVKKGDYFLNSSATIVSSAPFKMGGLDFEQNFNMTLDDLNKKFQDRSKADHMVLLTVGNYEARSTAASKIVISPNPAYVDLRPWWLSVFSASLLLGFPLEGSGRLMPGFCPYRTTLNIDQVYQMNELLGETLATPNQVVNIQSESFGVLSNEFNQVQGYLPSGPDKWIRPERNKDGQLIVTTRSLSDNSTLLVAVIVSLILAGILSIFGLFIFVYALYNAFTKFSKDSAHMSSYTKKYEQDWQKEKQEFNILDFQAPQNPPVALEMGKQADGLPRINQPNKVEKAPQEARTLLDKLKLTLINLPPPFALIDHLLFLLGRGITNSLIEYYRIVFVQVSDQDAQGSASSMALSEVKLRYEKFCFLKRYEERLMTTEKNELLLKKYGFEIKKKKDNSTEVYKKIRFFTETEEKTKKVLARQKLLNQKNQSQGASRKSDSVTLFIETNCVRTKFDTDSILVRDFKEKYIQFCEEEKLQTLDITRGLMASYGIQTEKLETNFICRKPLSVLRAESKGKAIKYYDIKLERAEKENDKIIVNYLIEDGKLKKKEQKLLRKKMGAPEPVKIFSQNWFLIDSLAVILHTVFTIAIALLPALIVAFSQIMRAFYLISSDEDVLNYKDFLSMPWNILSKLKTLRAFDIGFLIASAVFVGLAFIELIFYYLTMSFPLRTLKHFTFLKAGSRSQEVPKKKRVLQIVAKISHVIQWIYIFIFIALVFGYIGLVLVWSILGAILNPTAYLYYAAAAGTFITYVGVKYRQLLDLQRKGFTTIIKIIESKTKAMIDQLLKKVISKTGASEEMTEAIMGVVEAAEEGNLSKLESSAVQFVNLTPVGKKLSSIGLNPQLALRIVKGDVDAIIEFAQNKGIPGPVAKALIHLIQKDMDSLAQDLKELICNDPLNLPPDLVQFVISLVLKPGEASRREAINILGNTLFNLIKEKLNIKMPNFQACKLILPLFFQAIKELLEGDLDEFLQRVHQINEIMLNSCTQKNETEDFFDPLELKQIQDQNPKRVVPSQSNPSIIFMNEHGQPNYAIPRYLLYLIEIFKIPLSQLGVLKLTKTRMKKAVYDFLMNFCLMDDDVIDFMILTFASSHTHINAVMRPGVITQEMQINIVNQMSRELDLDNFVMKTLFKVMTKNKGYDDRLLTEAMDCCHSIFSLLEDVDSSGLHQNLIEISYGIFSLLNSVHIRQRLATAAKEYNFQDTTADVILKIASRVEYSKDSWNTLMSSDLIGTLSKQFHLTKHDVIGLISLLTGDLQNPNVPNILRQFCARNKVQPGATSVIQNVLAIFTSNVHSEVLQSIKALGLEEYASLIMIGRKMIHPKYIEDSEIKKFLRNESEEESDVEIPDRFDLNFQEEKIQDWIGKIIGIIKKNNNKQRPQQESARSPNLAFLSLFSKKQDIAGNLAKLLTGARNKQKISPEFAIKMLTISTQTFTTDFLNQILSIGKIRLESQLSQEELKSLVKILSVKDIILKGNKQSLTAATLNLVQVLGFDRNILEALITLLIAGKANDNYELSKALKEIYKQGSNARGGADSAQDSQISEFANFLNHELLCLSRSQRVLNLLSRLIGIPSRFIAQILTPYLSDASLISLNDVCWYFELAGFTEQKLEENNFKIKNGGYSQMRLILAKMTVGFIPQANQIQSLFEINSKLALLYKSLCSTHEANRLRTLIKFFRQMLEQQGLAAPTRELIIAVSVYLQGSNEPFFNPHEIKTPLIQQQKQQISAVDYLAQEFYVFPQFFQAIQTVLRGEHKSLPKLLLSLAQKLEVLGYEFIPPPIISGLLSLASGKIYSTEDLADKLNVSPELFEVCIHIASLANSKSIGKKITSLGASNAFTRLCKILKISKGLLLNLLMLAFCEFGQKDVSQVLGAFDLYAHCEQSLYNAMVTISSESLQTQASDKTRKKYFKKLTKSLGPLCQKFELPVELGVLSTRFAQGDINAIYDYQYYLAPLLPDQKCRNLAKGLWLALKMENKFKTKVGSNLKEQSNDFEQGVNILCKELGINPLVFRLCVLDKQAFEYAAKKYNVCRQLLLGFISAITWTRNGLQKLEYTSLLYRKVQNLMKRNKARLQKLQETSSRKSSVKQLDPKKNEELLRKFQNSKKELKSQRKQEKKDWECFKQVLISISKRIKKRTDQNSANQQGQEEQKKTGTEQEQAKQGENQKDGDTQSNKSSNKREEEDSKSEDSQFSEMSNYLLDFEALQQTAGQRDKIKIIPDFEQKGQLVGGIAQQFTAQFSDSDYENEYCEAWFQGLQPSTRDEGYVYFSTHMENRKPESVLRQKLEGRDLPAKSQSKIDLGQEIIETMHFNCNREAMLDYDILEYWYSQDAHIFDLTGGKEEYESVLQRQFVKVTEEENKKLPQQEQQNLDWSNFNFARKKDRKYIRNIWLVMKKMLIKIFKQSKFESQISDQNQPIELSHFIFAAYLVGRTVNVDDMSSKDYFGRNKAYEKFLNVLNWIQNHRRFTDKVSKGFSKVRFMKFLSLSYNFKFASSVDYHFQDQFSNDEINLFSYKENSNEVEILAQNKACEAFCQHLIDTSTCTYQEVAESLQSSVDYPQHDLAKLGMVEDIGFTRRFWKKDYTRFDYTPSKWKSKIVTDAELLNSKFIMVVPKSIALEREKQRKAQENNEGDIEYYDEVSSLPLQRAFNFFRDVDKFTIAEPEPLQLIIALAQNKQGFWAYFKEPLKSAKIVKKEVALHKLGSLQQLLNLKRIVRQYNEQKLNSDENFLQEAITIKPALSILLGEVSAEASYIEDLIMLALGNFQNTHIVSLSNRFNLAPNLLRTFFLSAYMPYLTTAEVFSQFLNPLVRLLGIESEKLMAIIDIVRYEKKGWMILGRFLLQARLSLKSKASQIKDLKLENKLKGIEIILDMVNWDKLRKKQSSKNMAIEQFQLVHQDFEDRLLQLADVIEGNSLNINQENIRVKQELELMQTILQKDFARTLDEIQEMEKNFQSTQHQGGIDRFISLCMLSGHFQLPREEAQEYISLAVKTLSKWLCSQVQQESDELIFSEAMFQINSKASGLIRLLLGISHKNRSLIEEAANSFGGGFITFYKMLTSLGNLRNFKHISLTDLVQNQRTREYVEKCFLLIAKLTWSELEQADIQRGSFKKFKRQEDSMQFNGIMERNNICNPDWISKLESFNDDNENYVLKRSVPSNQRRVKQWVEENPARKDFDKFEEEEILYQFLSSLMGGDVDLFLHCMNSYVRKKSKDDAGNLKLEKTTKLARSTFKIMNISKKNFLNEVENIFIKELKIEESKTQREQSKAIGATDSKMIQHCSIVEFSESLGYLNKLFFYRKLEALKKKSHSDYEKKRIEFAVSIFQTPEVLNYAITLLLAIKLGALGHKYIKALSIKFVEVMLEKSGINSKVRESFILMAEIYSGRDLQDSLTNINRGSPDFTFIDKIEKLISIFTNLFLPDLKSAEKIFRKIVSLVTALMNVKSLSQFSNIVCEYAPLVGAFFKADPIIVNGLVGILKGDYEALAQMAAPIAKIDPQTIRSTVNFLEEVKNTLYYFDDSQMEKEDKQDQFKGDRWREVMANIAAGKATYRELFEMLDAEGDGSGGISKDEFSMLLRRLRMKFSSHRVDEIFTSVQKKVSGEADDNPNELNELEFQEAMKYVESKQASSTLKLLGISTGQLIFLFIMLTIVLLLLFVFIFLGVSALSLASGGAFGSIINSILPIASGAAVMQKKETDAETDQANAEEAVQESNKILQAEQ